MTALPRDMEMAWTDALRRWWQLAQQDDCWTDPDKRRRMVRARLAYQDAKLNYVVALRPAPQRTPPTDRDES